MGAPNNQTIHKRKIGVVPYTAGGRASLEIDRDGACCSS